MIRRAAGAVAGGVVSLLAFTAGAPVGAQEHDNMLGGRRAAEILRDLGHSATVDEDSQGDPMVVFHVRGTKCTLIFYGCEGRRCASVQFRLGVATHGPDKPHLSRVNEWNRTKRYGRVYLDDERDPILEYDIDFAGGVAREQFAAAVGRWETLVSEFRRFFF